MAIIWLIMLSASLGLMLFTDPAAAVNSMITGAHGAVELSLNLLALYAFWLGFFALIERLGLSRGLERLLRPVTGVQTCALPISSCDVETRKYITMNVSANLLGLGNAATPMAITAINRMDDGNPRASTDMIMLTVISATSLQILPTTVIGMRATAGSANPADFLFPSLVATVLSTLIGIIGVKICARIFDRPRRKKSAVISQSAPLGSISPTPPRKQTARTRRAACSRSSRTRTRHANGKRPSSATPPRSSPPSDTTSEVVS